ncbi:intermembrane lipid transfer protein VPS13B-like isoform X2 [Artemia franciscana]
MLKIESYITPVILSYVDKYIKNLKPEDSQVSLWSGEAVFNNLDLRLETIESELSLPFKLSSGHIHELKIYVPWTKLASESIVITVNTIECTLNLKDINTESDSASESSFIARKKQRKQEPVVPPTYLQSLISRIINNIVLEFNNVILKYAEDDIVLSLNAPRVSYKAANADWKAAFSDIASPDFIARKLLTVTDLTVCLDKRNSLGKIDVFQEPLLYRSSLEGRLYMQYNSAYSVEPHTYRMDFFCNKLDFSMSDSQLPMFIRLLDLAYALHSGYFSSKKTQETVDEDEYEEEGEEQSQDDSWAGWAWSYVPPLNPFAYGTTPEICPEDLMTNQRSKVFNFGLYVEHISVTFKTTVGQSSRGHISTPRTRFVGHTVLKFSGCFMDSYIVGLETVVARMGIDGASMEPIGSCPCGSTFQEPNYLVSPSALMSKAYLKSSLFDTVDIEKLYPTDWEERILAESEIEMMSRTSFLAIDYFYSLKLPEDFQSNHQMQLQDFLEYSDYPEKALCRIFIGRTKLTFTPGLLHRLQMLFHSLKKSEYPPFQPPVIDTRPTDDVKPKINLRKYELKILSPVISFLPLPSHRSISRSDLSTDELSVMVKFDDIIVQQTVPMYPRRLANYATSCKNLDDQTVQSCYSDIAVVVSMEVFLGLNEHNTKLVDLKKLLYTQLTLIHPELWEDPLFPSRIHHISLEECRIVIGLPQMLVLNHTFLFLASPEHSSENFKRIVEDAVIWDKCISLKVFSLGGKVAYSDGCTSYNLSLTELEAFQDKLPIFISSKCSKDTPFISCDIVSGPLSPATLKLSVAEYETYLRQDIFDFFGYKPVPPPSEPVINQSEASTNQNSVRATLDSTAKSFTDGKSLNSSFFRLSTDSGMLLDVRPSSKKTQILNWLYAVSSISFKINIKPGVMVVGTRFSITLPSIEMTTECHGDPDRITPLSSSAFPLRVTVSKFSFVDCNDKILLPCNFTSILTKSEMKVTEADSTIDSCRQTSICIHSDLDPIVFSLSISKIKSIISATEMMLGFVDSLLSLNLSAGKVVPVPSGGLSDVSESSSLAGMKNKISIWFQLTIPKVAATLSIASKVLTLEVEDAYTSFDYQEVYMKLKTKVGKCTAWEAEEGTTLKNLILNMTPRPEDLTKPHNFFTATYTTAEIESFKSKIEFEEDQMPKLDMTKEKYISEVDIQLEQFDVKLSRDILQSFASIFCILMELKVPNNLGRNFTPVNKQPKSIFATINGSSLPLIYLQSFGVRFYVTLPGQDFDTFVLQVLEASITPQVDNKINRFPILRPDLYEYATKANLLDIPGSELEDRQYKLVISGFSVSLIPASAISMDASVYQQENPALRWNKLNCDYENVEEVKSKPIISLTDIEAVFAPAILHCVKSESFSESLVCGHSLEVYFTSMSSLYISAEVLELLFNTYKSFDFYTKVEHKPDKASSVTYMSCEVPITLYATMKKLNVHFFDEKSSSLLVNLKLLEPYIISHMIKNFDKFEFSAYDSSVSIGGAFKTVTDINETDYSLKIFETRSGEPIEPNGINPSFITLQLTQFLQGKGIIRLELGKPTKINLKLPLIQELKKVYQRMLPFLNEESEPGNSWGCVSSLHKAILKTSQIVLNIELMDHGVNCSFDNLSLVVSPEATDDGGLSDISLALDSITMTINEKMLMEPVNFKSYMNFKFDKNGHVKAVEGFTNFHKLILLLNPVIIEEACAATNELISCFNKVKGESGESSRKNVPEEQMRESVAYVDDLRTGPFQFLSYESQKEDMANPLSILPYQIHACNLPSSLVWKYPHPRILTRVEISPLPLEEASDFTFPETSRSVPCVLQFWCPTSKIFKSYQRFSLSDMQSTKLDLPSKNDRRNSVASSIWRVVMNLNEEDQKSVLVVKPETLLCSMRVDSCFDAHSLPNFQFSFNAREISVILDLVAAIGEQSKESIASTEVCLKKVSLSQTNWSGQSRFDLIGHLSVNMIDYRYLTYQNVLGDCPLEVTFFNEALSNASDLTVTIRDSVDIKMGQSVHYNIQCLLNSWTKKEVKNPLPFEIINRTNTAIGISQFGTEELITVLPISSVFYSWRSQRKKAELLMLIEATKFVRSEPFVLQIGKKKVALGFGTPEEVWLFLSVESVNRFCMKVTIEGQVSLVSIMRDKIEVSLIPSPTYVELPKVRVHASTVKDSSSLIIDISKMEGFHIRYANRDRGGGVWSGLVPLSGPRAKDAVLVKVPLADKEAFTTLWVHLIREKPTGRILVMFSPLYMIRSYLPSSIIVHSKTNGHSKREAMEIEGKGSLSNFELQGSIDSVYSLTFQIEADYPESPAVPLSYGILRNEKPSFDVPSISEILDSVESSCGWPYLQKGFGVRWVEAMQPNADIDIAFTRISPYCNTLLLDIRPWGLIINQSSVNLCLKSVDIPDPCNIPVDSVLATPRLSSMFSLEFDCNDGKVVSEPLQLIESSSKPGYRPKVDGSININCFTRATFAYGDKFYDLVLHCRQVNDIILILVLDPVIVSNFVPGLLVSSPTSHSTIFQRQGNNYLMDLKLCGDPCPIVIDCNKDFGNLDENAFDVKRFVASVPLCLTTAVVTMPVVIAVGFKHGVTSIDVAEDVSWTMLLYNTTKEIIIVAEANEETDCVQLLPESAVHFSHSEVVSKFPGTHGVAFLKRLRFTSLMEGKMTQWSNFIDVSCSYDQIVCIPHCIDLKVHIEMKSNKYIVYLQPISRMEVSASEIRKKLVNKGAAEEMKHNNVEVVAEETIYGNMIQKKKCHFENLHQKVEKILEPVKYKRKLFFSSYIKLLSFTLLDDVSHESQARKEVLHLTAKQLVLCLRPTNSGDLQGLICMERIQVDNQMMNDSYSSYNWPVIFYSKTQPLLENRRIELPIEQQIAFIRKNSFLQVNFSLYEDFRLRRFAFEIGEFSALFEDTLYFRLKDIFKSFYSNSEKKADLLYPFNSSDLSRISSVCNPLVLERFFVSEISGSLSIRSSVKIYLALDHTPVKIGNFTRQDVLSTSYDLGQAFSAHCLSNILFKAGIVLGSLEIIGSPTLLVQRFSTGFKDFVKLPYHGLFEGPKGFIAGVLNGSVSLISHITGGTLLSLTQVADNVARNLDRLTLDSEHILLREEGWRRRPKDLTEGISRGLSDLGLSILGAVGGLAHHPVQSLLEGRGATGFALGVTKGAIGLVTKPLGGAASFVASTGKGLLAGSYDVGDVNVVRPPFSYEISEEKNSEVKIRQKLRSSLLLGRKDELHIFEAMRVTSREVFTAVTLILTEEVLLFLDGSEDTPEAVLSLRDLECQEGDNDPTMVCIRVKKKEASPIFIGEEVIPPFDPKRIHEYLASCTGMVFQDSSAFEDGVFESGVIRLVLNPGERDHFVCVVKRFLSQFLSDKF